MTGLREEIWRRVLPVVQARRLEPDAAGADGMEVCRRVASEEFRALEAEAIHTAGRGLGDGDVVWLHERLESVLGAGPLEPLLRRGDVENIYVFGPHRVVLGLTGGRQEPVAEPLFDDCDDLVGYVSHLAATHGQTGRRFDQSAPLLDLRLRTGERVFAAMSVCAQPYLTVRCHRHRSVSLAELSAGGSLSAQAAEFLAAAVRPPSPANVLVCGALGAGKTTLLRALLAEVGGREVVCTLEQTFELFLDDTHPLTFAAETREPNSDGSGEITMDELARRSLRSGADRIIVGELRGSEAAVFLSACGTGSDGSMATIHAASARQALARLVRYCLGASGAASQSALVQEAADVIHLVVFMRGDHRSGLRAVHTITEVLGADGDNFATHDIFTRGTRGGDLTMVDGPRNADLAERVADGGLDTTGWPRRAEAQP